MWHRLLYAWSPRTKALPAAELVGRGQLGLNPGQVLESLDTLALPVTAPGAAERSYAMLLRRTIRKSAGRIPVLRETQHYEFANGTNLDDTLGVSASTLAPLRYFGADDYVVTPVAFLELMARVAALLTPTTRGVSPTDDPYDTVRFGDVIVKPAPRDVTRADGFIAS
ncbi:MAG: hypothetical protein ABI035_00225 [Gemmatimonadaceae bacterium]